MQPLVYTRIARSIIVLVVTTTFALLSTPVLAGEYDNALKGVKQYNAVFEFSQGDPNLSNLIFWAVKNAYEVDEVKAMKPGADIVVVFHGPVVKLISSDMAAFKSDQQAEIKKFQESIRQMKKDGVRFEVCQYAAKVVGVDTATILPEIDQVGNGFVSVIGYQMQGYAVVRVP